MRGALDIRRLRYFLAVTEAGSMSAAARALNLAQPALSYHVAELERATGHPLFERSRQGVTPTAAGRLLRRHAREILDRVEAAERAMDKVSRRRDGRAARIRVAIISSLAADLTPLLVARTARTMPDLTLHIIEAGTRDIERKLGRAEADMAVYLASTHGPGEQPLATEQLFLLAPAAGGGGLGGVSLPEVARHRLILPAPGNPLRDFVQTVASQHGLELDVVLEVDGSRPRRNAVLNGIGSTILGARSVVSEALDAGLDVREIVSPRLFRPIYLGSRRDLDPALRELMSAMLRSALRDLGLGAPQGG